MKAERGSTGAVSWQLWLSTESTGSDHPRWNELRLAAFRFGTRFCAGGTHEMSDRPKCPTCEFRMVHLSRPLLRLFGDVRAFQCQPCDFMVLLRYPFNLLSKDDTQPRLDAAE